MDKKLDINKIFQTTVSCYGREIPAVDILNALTKEELEGTLETLAQCLEQEGRIQMLKIQIKTFGGEKVEGQIRSDKDFYYLDNDGKRIGWMFAEGDIIEILEDVDSVDVPILVKASVNIKNSL